MPIIDYTPHQSRIRPKETLKAETERVIRALIITLGLMIFALSVIFIFTTSQNAQKGYILKQDKILNDSLKTKQADLGFKVNDSTAYNNLDENTQVKKMSPAETKSYITKEDNLVK